MSKPTDYVWIALWGRQLGSYDYYIEHQQCKAAETGAPLDAIYEETGPGGVRTGKWHTASGIVNEDTRNSLRSAAERAGVKIPETWQ